MGTAPTPVRFRGTNDLEIVWDDFCSVCTHTLITATNNVQMIYVLIPCNFPITWVKLCNGVNLPPRLTRVYLSTTYPYWYVVTLVYTGSRRCWRDPLPPSLSILWIRYNSLPPLTMAVADQDRISDFELKLMDIDSEHLGIPKTEYNCIVQVNERNNNEDAN